MLPTNTHTRLGVTIDCGTNKDQAGHYMMDFEVCKTSSQSAEITLAWHRVVVSPHGSNEESRGLLHPRGGVVLRSGVLLEEAAPLLLKGLCGIVLKTKGGIFGQAQSLQFSSTRSTVKYIR